MNINTLALHDKRSYSIRPPLAAAMRASNRFLEALHPGPPVVLFFGKRTYRFSKFCLGLERAFDSSNPIDKNLRD